MPIHLRYLRWQHHTTLLPRYTISVYPGRWSDHPSCRVGSILVIHVLTVSSWAPLVGILTLFCWPVLLLESCLCWLSRMWSLKATTHFRTKSEGYQLIGEASSLLSIRIIIKGHAVMWLAWLVASTFIYAWLATRVYANGLANLMPASSLFRVFNPNLVRSCITKKTTIFCFYILLIRIRGVIHLLASAPITTTISHWYWNLILNWVNLYKWLNVVYQQKHTRLNLP